MGAEYAASGATILTAAFRGVGAAKKEVIAAQPGQVVVVGDRVRSWAQLATLLRGAGAHAAKVEGAHKRKRVATSCPQTTTIFHHISLASSDTREAECRHLHAMLQPSNRLYSARTSLHGIRTSPTRAVVQAQARRQARVSKPNMLHPQHLLQRLQHPWVNKRRNPSKVNDFSQSCGCIAYHLLRHCLLAASRYRHGPGYQYTDNLCCRAS